jgi:peptidoglycan hydrolase-like protein with peptidoglycan-binding domain
MTTSPLSLDASPSPGPLSEDGVELAGLDQPLPPTPPVPAEPERGNEVSAHPAKAAEWPAPAPTPLEMEPLLIEGRVPPQAPSQASSSSAAAAVELPTRNLARGAAGPEVAQLQQALVQLGYLPAGAADASAGRFDASTEAALKQLQAAFGAAPDGRLGPRTRWAFEQRQPDAQPVASSQAAADDVTGSAVGLHRGDQGPQVEQLQRALVRAGYLTAAEVDTGPGIFGPRTEAALRRFQAATGAASSASA